MTIRVMVVAAAPIVRSGLAAMLTTDRNMTVVGMIADLELLASEVNRLRPDAILMDLGNFVGTSSLPDCPSIWETLLSIQEIQDPIGIVLTIGDLDNLDINGAIRAGVRGILPHNSSESQIIATVVAVSMGLVVLVPDALELFYVPGKAQENPGFSLTPREIEVLHRLGSGLGNKAIAHSLHISEHTVKFHISSIFQKLGVSTRTEAVTVGVRLGLILL
jgi:two-component system, NarL family, response regulator YdfI